MAGGGGVVAEKDPQGVKKEEITLKKDGGWLHPGSGWSYSEKVPKMGNQWGPDLSRKPWTPWMKRGAMSVSQWFGEALDAGIRSAFPLFPKSTPAHLRSQYLFIVPGSFTCKINEVNNNAEDVLCKQGMLSLLAHGCSYTTSHRTGLLTIYGTIWLALFCHFIRSLSNTTSFSWGHTQLPFCNKTIFF